MRRWILLFLTLLGLLGPDAVAAEVSSPSPANCSMQALASSTAASRIPESVPIQLTYVRPDRLKTSHGQPLQEAVAAAIGLRHGIVSAEQTCSAAGPCAAGNSDVAPGSASLVVRLEPHLSDNQRKQSVTRLHLTWRQAAAGSTPETADLLIPGPSQLFVQTAMQYIRPKLNGLLDRLEVPLAASAPPVCRPPPAKKEPLPPLPLPLPLPLPTKTPLLHVNGHVQRTRKALPFVSGALLLGSVVLLN